MLSACFVLPYLGSTGFCAVACRLLGLSPGAHTAGGQEGAGLRGICSDTASWGHILPGAEGQGTIGGRRLLTLLVTCLFQAVPEETVS